MNKKCILTLIVSIIVVTLFNCGLFAKTIKDNKNIKVGILHSLTGTMAISENAVVDATLLAP